MGLTLYSVFHKSFIYPDAAFVKPIQAGKLIAKEKLSIQGDDSGDNISALNPYFCELTAMYWIWKNANRTPDEYWGLCHYRRYFTTTVKRLLGKPKPLVNARSTQEAMDQYINEKTENQIIGLLRSHDVLIQTPMYLYKKKGVVKTQEQHYREEHISEHWDIMKKNLLELYPSYADSFYSFANAKKISFFNMAVGVWKFWDGYLNWLFPLLFVVHKQIKLTGDPYQDRAIGFLAERLLNLYVWHNRLKIAYLPVVIFDKQ